jgi:hypothetical protein
MNFAKAIVTAMVVALGAALVGARASAQQPTAAVTAGPNWCTDAPASPPPPGFELRPGDWANVRKMCAAHMYDRGCVGLCAFAEELWRRKKAAN